MTEDKRAECERLLAEYERRIEHHGTVPSSVVNDIARGTLPDGRCPTCGHVSP